MGLLAPADGVNAYRVLGSRDGTSFSDLGILRRTGQKRMRQRAWFWDPSARPRQVRIERIAGERGFWIGEVEFIEGERTELERREGSSREAAPEVRARGVLPVR